MYSRPRRPRGAPGTLQVLGPGVWHSAAAQAAYIDLRPHQTFIAGDKLYDDLHLFGDILDKRIDDDLLADKSNDRKREILGCSLYGPGKKNKAEESLKEELKMNRTNYLA